MTGSLDTSSLGTYVAYSMTKTVDIEEAIETAPGSIRELAREAGVSDSLLRHVRDGRRRLTSDTKTALAAALRRWSDRCRKAAAGLDPSAEPESRRDG